MESQDLIDKDGALREFLTELRVTLKNISLFQAGHASIVLAAGELKRKIDELHHFLSPVKVHFLPHGLRVEDRVLDDHPLYRDLARIFHHRKVKSLAIDQGVELYELLAFLSPFAIPAKDVVAQGGLNRLLEGKNILHLRLDDLDYSPLLKDDGEEVADAWAYLLQEAPKAGQEGLSEEAKAAISRRAANLLREVIRRESVVPDGVQDEVKAAVSLLRPDDLAAVLHEEIVADAGFDGLSFKLFSKLTDGDPRSVIAPRLADLLGRDLASPSGPEVVGKLKKLLAGGEPDAASDNYRKSLERLLQSAVPAEGRRAESAPVGPNYRSLLLNLLDRETQEEFAAALVEDMAAEWADKGDAEDFPLLQEVLGTLAKKEKLLAGRPAARRLRQAAVRFAERSLLAGETRPEFEALLAGEVRGILEPEAYLEAIFGARRVDPSLLGTYLRFHPKSLVAFEARLETGAGDAPFMTYLLEVLEKLDGPAKFPFLKSIFTRGGREVKIRALRALGSAAGTEEAFLLSLLGHEDLALRREAYLALAKTARSESRAVEAFLAAASPFGIRNSTLIENLAILRETGPGRTVGPVRRLARKRGPWNRKLRKEARRVLEAWNAG
ncbi:MAG: hypothetical protein FJY80_02915 [Candidatus Aminicenantes bacterium]|nr:hypothetical protein [Candidatus Aminicenantes bacterium]